MAASAFVVLALLLACGVPTSHAIPALSTRAQNGLQYLFTFQEGQLDSRAASTTDLSGAGNFGSLAVKANIPNPSVDWIANSVGVSFPQTAAASFFRVASSSTAANLLNQFTASNQFTFEFTLQPTPANQPARSVLWQLTTANPGVAFQACTGTDGGIRIEHQDATVTIYINDDSSPCDFLGFPVIEGRRYHVVLTYSGTRITLYINNVEILSKAATINFASWNTAALMQVGMMTLNNAGWKGTMYLMAAYNRSLSTTEIARNFAARMANSRPVPTVSVADVARVVGGNITLNGTDFDGDRLTVYITSLPTKGQLFVFNQSSPVRLQLITAASVAQPRLLTSLNLVFFRPDAFDFGPNYATFTYQVFDGTVFSRSGTVTVRVNYTAVPPAASPSTQQAFAGVFTALQLNGTTVDLVNGVRITGATVTSLPANGTLFQTADGVNPGAQINTVPTTVTHPNRLVIYRSFNLSSAQLTGASIVLVDSFNFRVQDSNALLSSSTAAVTVQVLNPLQAPAGTSAFPEDTLGNVTFPSLSRDGSPVDTDVLGFTPSNAGTLYTPTGVAITNFPYTIPNRGKVLRYVPRQYDFGSPQVQFTYRARANGIQSSIGTVAVNVQFVNNRPVLSQDFTGDLTVPVNAALDQQVKFSLTLFDPDRATQDYTLVVVCAFGASITLNTSAIPFLQFDAGDGYTDPDIEARASQSIVSSAMRNMIFHGEFVGSGRQCTFTVRDNDPTNPLSGTLKVTAVVVQNEKVVSSSNVASIYIYLAYVGIIGAPACCCLLICCKCYRSYRERRGDHLSSGICAHCSLSLFGEAKQAQRLRRTDSMDGVDSAYGGKY